MRYVRCLGWEHPTFVLQGWYNQGMLFSDFGNKMRAEAGILQLMDDLGKALADTPPMAMFGGGNPAQIPAVTQAYADSLRTILGDEKLAGAMLGNYDTPQGHAGFITAITAYLNRHFNLGITEENVAITPGSQTGYFLLFNLIAGRSGHAQRKIMFPLVPEYIGYADQGLEPDMFCSLRPRIQKRGAHAFKYYVDLKNLRLSADIAAVCVSRPTNPSGNVVSYQELLQLAARAAEHEALLVIDNAYGLPFPGVIQQGAGLFWDTNVVHSMSLSKVGLPTSRVGIFVGPAELMRALASANAIVSLASPSIGQYVARPLLEDDAIDVLCQQHIQPYYQARRSKMDQLIAQHFPPELPWRLHAYEGSYFYWLWCEGARMTSGQMYEWLKARGVLVVPGQYFFPGQPDDWTHKHECLRINFARPDAELEAGVPLLAEAIKVAY